MMEEKYTGIDDLLTALFQGNASAEDMARVESWILESPENHRHYLQLKNIWDSSVNLPLSSEIALQRVMKQIKPEKPGKVIWMMWQRVAAIILLPLLVAALWLMVDRNREERALASSFQTVNTAFGSYTSLELPDGSKVWLNSGSTLRYPVKFNARSRQVFLKGEGYFEVHSDPASPFLVSTSEFTVRATGTRFNVSSYEHDTAYTVTLLEGKVAVQAPANGGAAGILATLHPRDHFYFDRQNHTSSITQEETYKYIAWKEGKLVFRNDLFSEVARRISLQYNIDVIISNPKIRTNRYWATFKNEPLNELLRLLKLTAPIDYREIDPVLQTDGSFSKRKIIIYSTDTRNSNIKP